MVILFQDIEVSEDFFKFFDDRFEIIENNLEKHFKIYKVSIDEILTVLVSEDENPQNFDDSHYFIILFSKENRNDYVRIFGSFFNDKGAIQYNNSRHLPDKKLSNKNLISKMDNLEYVKQSINPHLLLFGLTKKQRFAKGDLINWNRNSEGKFFAKEDLKERIIRVRKWEEDHPSSKDGGGSNFKLYNFNECLKANCTHLKNNECQMETLPHNDNSEFKLQGGTGYCEEYNTKEIDSTIEEIFLPLREFNIRLEKIFKLYINKFDSIHYQKFDLNIVAHNFDSRRFAILIGIIKSLNDFSKEKDFMKFNSEFKDKDSHFNNISFSVKAFSKRKVLKKPYKKAKKEMELSIKIFIRRYRDLISELYRKIKILRLYNKLTNRLFSGKEHFFSSFDSLKEDMFIYFVNSKTSETTSWKHSKNYSYFNVGRIQNNSGWEDYNLAPHRYFSVYDKISYYKKYPIYRVVSISKGEVKIEDIETNEIIKLISNRQYEPQILFFKPKRSQLEKLLNFEYIENKNNPSSEIIHTKKPIKMAKIDEFF